MINCEHCFVFLNKSSFGAEAEAESGEEQKHYCLTDAMANNAATNSHNKQAISSLIRPPALTVKVQADALPNIKTLVRSTVIGFLACRVRHGSHWRINQGPNILFLPELYPSYNLCPCSYSFEFPILVLRFDSSFLLKVTLAKQPATQIAFRGCLTFLQLSPEESDLSHVST